jgi:ParB family chromosome partitioning protein
VRELADLRSRGYNHTEIGKKTGMGANYVGELLYLYDRGEEHLLNAVDAGKISLSSAIIISRSEYKDVQSALLKSLEEKKITIKELQRARVLADMRKAFGKSQSESKSTKLPKVTSDTIIRTFRREQQRQQQAIRKSDLCEKRLSFASSAFRKLFKDENFINLLRAEGLDSIPEYLAAQIGKDNQ